ncbi:MAG: outer membrane lipoprotein carrier protein LolA [Henriciella sp.]|mgnify:CR=1 FL=1|uniref:LolA family protein n=1 Tax=Henriciella sp. TaxID=1968823 RepID=UPI002621CD64|nr:outer membrane lipoprotein carrier protein LolA [Henriciella sp.]
MTSLLHPLAAVIMMGGVPLAFEADPAFLMPVSAPVVVHAAQSAPAQTAADQTPQARPVAEPAEERVATDSAQPNETAEKVTPPSEDPGVLTAADRQAILDKAASALASAKTAKGRFTQVSPDGGVTHGDFALRRPGRMRFDYDAPTPILIVSDGTTVAMEDSELETVDRVPLASTPLGLILDDKLDFKSEARVVDVKRGNKEVAITVEDRAGESEGQLTLFFDKATYQLNSWRALDANRQTTLVSLEDVKTNVSVDPRLFIMEDPADEEEDER